MPIRLPHPKRNLFDAAMSAETGADLPRAAGRGFNARQRTRPRQLGKHARRCRGCPDSAHAGTAARHPGTREERGCGSWDDFRQLRAKLAKPEAIPNSSGRVGGDRCQVEGRVRPGRSLPSSGQCGHSWSKLDPCRPMRRVMDRARLSSRCCELWGCARPTSGDLGQSWVGSWADRTTPRHAADVPRTPLSRPWSKGTNTLRWSITKTLVRCSCRHLGWRNISNGMLSASYSGQARAKVGRNRCRPPQSGATHTTPRSLINEPTATRTPCGSTVKPHSFGIRTMPHSRKRHVF